MCGIWGIICSDKLTKCYKSYFDKLKKRGPDTSIYYESGDIKLGFARLSIMDKSNNGNQPFIIEEEDYTIYIICNGEIYEYKEIIKKYNLKVKSNSDCEVIGLLYNKFKKENNVNIMKKVLNEIKGGEFSFVIIDENKNNKDDRVIYLATDPTSVRPLFYSLNNSVLSFSSELKGITYAKNVKRLKGGICKQIKYKNKKIKICEYMYHKNQKITINNKYIDEDINVIYNKVYNCLKYSVSSMLKSDRPIGALLSGGLDSSLVVGLASKILKEKGKKLKTFSIGLPGGTDEKYALKVSEYCDTDHKHIKLNVDNFIKSIDDVINVTETFDITTIRASIGQYLISKWIKENTNIKVLLVGDGSDELCSGYKYFHYTPDPISSHNENCRLLDDIHLYDGLRADRCVSANGLEARLPFLKSSFIDLYLSIDPKLRIPINGVEKYLLRKSFESKNIIPKEVLFRSKEAFSDGVSNKKKSLYIILQEHFNKYYTDSEYERNVENIKHCKPLTKEALYYRMKFNKIFGIENAKIIPYFWLPKWCGDIKEPSARILNNYK